MLTLFRADVSWVPGFQTSHGCENLGLTSEHSFSANTFLVQWLRISNAQLRSGKALNSNVRMYTVQCGKYSHNKPEFIHCCLFCTILKLQYTILQEHRM